ncbi:hypothetical protein [Humibacillus xanthopallidus]|uniref:hypothetical protein n=1 Tax=Humibacillus xanthopallidus TaxID=412689 RepID=UPI00384D009C
MRSSRTPPGSRELAELAHAARTAVTFVQVAGGAMADARGLTLTDLSPSTIWVLHDTPQRVGHLATGTFLDLWWDPRSGLSSCRLRAVLGQADPDTQLLGAPVLTVASPRISGSGVGYEIEVLSGVLPADIGSCILFIGPGDRCADGPSPAVPPP